MTSIISYYFPNLAKKYGLRRTLTIADFCTIFLDTFITELKTNNALCQIPVNMNHDALVISRQVDNAESKEIAYKHALISSYSRFKDENWLAFYQFLTTVTNFYDSYKDDISGLKEGVTESSTYDDKMFSYKCRVSIETKNRKKSIVVTIYYYFDAPDFVSNPYIVSLQKVFT